MTIDTGNLLDQRQERKPGDFHRNHQGAPYVTHPTDIKKDGTPKRVVYGRPSSFGSALDNAYNLLKWKERQLLIGAHWLEHDDPSLFFRMDPDDREFLDGLAARCHQAAGSSLAADRGTHIHLLCEQVDRGQSWIEGVKAGEELGIPAALQKQIMQQWETFRRELGVTALAIEATVVHDGWRLAGTLDRLDIAEKDILTGLGVVSRRQPFIGDIKTGSLTLGRDGQPNYWVKYPVQLAAYADGVPYDVSTDERGEWETYWEYGGNDGKPHQDIALIYHYDLAQALDGVPTDWQAIPVNLQAGREGGNLCRLAADFGRRRDLFLMPTPKEPTCPNTTPSDLLDTTSLSASTTSETAPNHTTSGSSPKTNSTTTSPTSSKSQDAGPTSPLVDNFHIVVSDGRRGSVTVPTSRTWITAKVRELAIKGHDAVLRQQWPQGVPPLTDTSHTVEQLTQLFHMVRRVETEVGAPFDPEPSSQPFHEKMTVTYVSGSTQPDDGAFLDPGEIELLKNRMLALPDHRHEQLAAISCEANAAGRPISVTQKPCIRRWEIARALVLWAETDLNLDDLFCRVTYLCDDHQVVGEETLGAVLSQFTIEQACQLADIFQPE